MEAARELVDAETGEIVSLPARVEGHFDIASVTDPTRALRVAEELVKSVAQRCSGDQYVAGIAGKQYPKVEWWTTVGASLGLFPREERNRRLDREGEVAYEATVGVYRGDGLVTRASAICSSREKLWANRDEYAIKSMATTRATGKAYRIGLSFLAVMAGLEPTSAEEMTSEPEPFGLDRPVGFGKHEKRTWAELVEKEAGYVRWAIENVDRLTEAQKDVLREALAPEKEEAPKPNGEPATKAQKARILNLMELAGIAPDVRAKKAAKLEEGITGQAAEDAITELERRIEGQREEGEAADHFFTDEERAVPQKDALRQDIIRLMGELGWTWMRVHELTDEGLSKEHDPEAWKPGSWATVFMALPLADCQQVHEHIVERAGLESDDG